MLTALCGSCDPSVVRRIGVILANVALVLASAGAAHAEPTAEDKALANSLFGEAKTLLADGKVPEACRKLEESRRLDPLPGTLLNLAACHEREGLMASAFAEFREARTLAERDHRDDRIAFADEHLAAIEPKISKLVIVVGPDADLPDLRVTRDGTPLGRAAWSTKMPVDPGEHVIEASAPNRKTRRIVVNVGRDGAVETTTLIPLETESAPETQAPPPQAPPPQQDSSASPVAPPQPPAEQPPSNGWLTTRGAAMLAAGGAGIVAIGIGSGFGISAIQKHDDPRDSCTLPNCDAATKFHQGMKSDADVATVSFAVAGVALAAAAYLFFTDPGRNHAATVIRIAPAVGPRTTGLALDARF
jgi:hypothetical protein